MSGPGIIPRYPETQGTAEAKFFGPHFMQLPDGRSAQMIDANHLFAGIRTHDGGALEGGSEFIVLHLIHACSECQHGLVYQLTADQAESVAAQLTELASEIKANAATLANAALDRARKGPAK